MKITIFFLFVTLMQVSAAGLAQNITFKKKSATLEQVFREITRQSGYNFFYPDAKIDHRKSLNADFRETPLKVVLDQIFDGSGYFYTIDDKNIIVKSAPISAASGSGKSKRIDVHGTVTDDKGAVLAGASVHVKNATKTALTDKNGHFLLVDVEPGATIIISYLGFQTREVAAAADLGTISLQPGVSGLDEIQIIGYGTTTQKKSTGSIKSIKASEIARQPVTNPLLALQGNVPGMYISQTNGLPGSAVNIRIRGQNSIGAGNNPLYIIDGVPFNSEPINQQSGGSYSLAANGNTSPFNSINPNDIESISVLKDADATAIYGSRAANGVVLITTKQGKSGKARVNFNVYTGVGRSASKMSLLNTQQYLELRRQAFENDNSVPDESNAPDLTLWGEGYTDFQKLLFGNSAHITEASTSLSGGSETTTFMLSGTYRNEGSVLPGDQGYKRGSLLFKVNHTSADSKFNASMSSSISKDVNNLNPVDVTSLALTLPPNYPLYNPDGSLYWDNNFSNPLAMLRDPSRSSTYNIITNVNLGYKILPELTLKTSLGYNRMGNDERNSYLQSNSGPDAFDTFTSLGSHVTEGFIIEPQLNYNKNFGKGKLEVLAGGTYQVSESTTPYSAGLSGFANERLAFNMSSAADIIWLDNFLSRYKYASVFGRVNYQLNEKYILNASFRRDGSSRFGPEKKFGNFGAVGAAWIFSEEEFIKNSLSFLSFGKLRASYGTIGNDQIPNYGYLSTYRSNNFRYGDLPGMYPARIPNPEYSWESTRKLEIALEMGFLKDRIMFSVAGYRNRTSNMLVESPLSPQTGFSFFQANLPATVQNTGIELELNTENIKTKNFTWNTSFNITIPRNKLVSFPNILETEYANTYIVGQPLSIIPAYHVTGISNGIAQFEDVNGDGEISTGIAANGQGDFIVAGQTDPRLYGGLSNSLSYKGLQLDIFIQFTRQTGYNSRFESTRPPGSLFNQDMDLVKDGLRPTAEFGTEAYECYIRYAMSERAVSDASFARLKNVSLSYSLPQAWTKSLHINGASIYLRGQNLLTLTKYQGLDPEMANLPGFVVPPQRLYTIGVQFSL
ncbi:TonB-dependent receptor [Pedobacter panaciterrae]|uniref:TonB-dependent receptor n=1 Tax=Pedobacter panaciterrae TaxID=363849 RepID=A0ABU8NHH1_9SPHI